MKKRMKKAAFAAAFGYCAVLALGLGMLRTAQQTRRILYGGMPVMAQLSQPVRDQPDYQLALGGGEWNLALALPDFSAAAEYAAMAPPCTGSLWIRLFLIADSAADQIAERIRGL